MILSAENVTKSFAGRLILDRVDLKIEDQDRIGLIGANGAGKSTLLKLLLGEEIPDQTVPEASISINRDATIGILKQTGGLSADGTLYEEMLSVFSELVETERAMRRTEREMASEQALGDPNLAGALSKEYERLQAFFEAKDGYLIDVKIKTILNGMGFADKPFTTPVSTLSGGEKTRLALSKLLLEQPDLLILDEPTNHLDFKTLLWLEDYLLSYKGALLVVSHDRYFLDKIVTSICEIERTHLTRYKGNYTKFLQLKEEQLIRQQKEYDLQQEKIADLEDYVARNIVRATTAKSAKSKLKALEHMERIEKPKPPLKPPRLRFTFDRDPVKDVLHVRDLELAVGFGERRRVLQPSLDFDLLRGEKVALIGANGVGKSSFLKAVLGLIPVLHGEIEIGRHVQTAFYEQENKQLNPENTALEELWGRHPRMNEHEVRQVLGSVLLTGENVYKKVSQLSGGERAKLAFAVLMLEHGNLLILDEPTNHMDLATREAIDQALMEFEGTLLMVSHDRYLLNRVPTKIVEMFPGSISVYDGNYDYYLAKTQQVQPPAAPEKPIEKPAVKQEDGYYRTKQQRSEQAKLRKQQNDLEKSLQQTEQQLNALQQEIEDPEVAANYTLLSEKCAQIERLRCEYDQLLEQWLELTQ